MIRVRVPATSANLGPGFDAFGMAFELYNIYSFEEKDDGKLTIRGVERRYQGKNNLVYRAMLKVFNKVQYQPKGLYIYSDVNIPVSRGLGSSAACIVAGLVGANALCGAPLSGKELFDMAVEMEGHPDNVTPALYGGLTVSLRTENDNYYLKHEVHDDFEFWVAIPDFTLPTIQARRALPPKIHHRDAVFNIGRATMTYQALIDGRADLLKISMDDRLHEPYRRTMIEGYDALTEKVRSLGAVNYCISGAGPSILIINEKDNLLFGSKLNDWLDETLPNFKLLALTPDNTGVAIDQQT